MNQSSNWYVMYKRKKSADLQSTVLDSRLLQTHYVLLDPRLDSPRVCFDSIYFDLGSYFGIEARCFLDCYELVTNKLEIAYCKSLYAETLKAGKFEYKD